MTPVPHAAAGPRTDADDASLPVAVIGAGPVGLAAAAHLLARGERPLVLEASADVTASVRAWGHVRLFTPWRYATDAAATALLADAGWAAPDPEAYPTGTELVERYLAPLAALPAVRPHLRLGARVTGITRRGIDKMRTAGREEAPFVLAVRDADGGEARVLAKAVIDASGTWTTPNPLGADGLPALGEAALAERIAYGIPDVLGADRARYADRTVLVAGSGASAFNALLDLADLAEAAPGTRVVWLTRRGLTGGLFGGGEADQLPERGALGRRVRALVEREVVRVAAGVRVTAVRRAAQGVTVHGEGDVVIGPVDEVIVATGFRPDLSILGELRLALDPAVESPVALAPLIDPNVHSCGTVRPHGAAELAHPEPNFYVVGSKSYGRAPTFLLLTGYEQARSVAAAIVGDWAAAREVRLVLPETGVCSTAGLADRGGACCGTAATAPADAAAPAACCAPEPTQVIRLATATVPRP